MPCKPGHQPGEFLRRAARRGRVQAAPQVEAAQPPSHPAVRVVAQLDVDDVTVYPSDWPDDQARTLIAI